MSGWSSGSLLWLGSSGRAPTVIDFWDGVEGLVPLKKERRCPLQGGACCLLAGSRSPHSRRWVRGSDKCRLS